MNFVVAVFFKIFILIVGIIPFKFLYWFSDFVAFLLFKIVKYRVNVVINNLKKAFPEKTDKEIEKIARKTYKNLSDITIEGIKVFTMSTSSLLKRFKIKNSEILNTYQEKQKSVILLAAHYGNWEWGVITSPIQINQNLVGLYKPLANKYIDTYLRKSREREGTILASIYNTNYYFKKYVKKEVLFVMIADQSPSNLNKAIWVNFFGRETAFLHGPEKYAYEYNLPVFFIEVKRLKRGYYEYELQLLTDTPQLLEHGEITRRYAQMVEMEIRKKPENWLWSHRRWKHSKKQ